MWDGGGWQHDPSVIQALQRGDEIKLTPSASGNLTPIASLSNLGRSLSGRILPGSGSPLPFRSLKKSNSADPIKADVPVGEDIASSWGRQDQIADA